MFSVARHVVRQLERCRPLGAIRVAREDFEEQELFCASNTLFVTELQAAALSWVDIIGGSD